MKRIIAALLMCVAVAIALLPRAAYPHNPTTTTVLFNREVASLLQHKCLQCHAEGKLAMPLGTYAQARPWAESIKEEILTRRMPPWPAERGFGTFSNDVGLTPREFEFLISWIDGGVPEGGGEAPAFVDHGAHWMLGTPDVVLAPRSGAVIDARSAPAMKRLIIDTGFARDTWVRGFDFKVGDARVVRAAFLSIDGTDSYLGAWTPWQSALELPDRVGFKMPAHSRIAVDVMYSGTAERVIDTPKLGLYLASSAPARTLSTSTLRPAPDAAVAPGKPVVAELTVRERRSLLSLRPAMRDGARSLEVTLLRPDGSREVLLWVKEFRQDWPTPFVLRQPITLPAGAMLRATAYFDRASAGSEPPFAVTVSDYPSAARQ
jgi:hypothetical protein